MADSPSPNRSRRRAGVLVLRLWSHACRPGTLAVPACPATGVGSRGTAIHQAAANFRSPGTRKRGGKRRVAVGSDAGAGDTYTAFASWSCQPCTWRVELHGGASVTRQRPTLRRGACSNGNEPSRPRRKKRCRTDAVTKRYTRASKPDTAGDEPAAADVRHATVHARFATRAIRASQLDLGLTGRVLGVREHLNEDAQPLVGCRE